MDIIKDQYYAENQIHTVEKFNEMFRIDSGNQILLGTEVPETRLTINEAPDGQPGDNYLSMGLNPICDIHAESTGITFNYCSGDAPKLFLVFHADGRVTADPDCDMDEAAQGLIKTVQGLWRQIYTPVD